jgi:putative hydrolase of the HAD superfamily
MREPVRAGAVTVGGAWPERVETVLLDAGGVLLDLDYRYLRRLIEVRHPPVTEKELSRQEAIARTEIHRHVSDGGRVSDTWRDYFHLILGGIGVPAPDQDAVIDALWEAHERFGLWTVPIDGGPETVAELKRRGMRIGVVSNAEGRVERDLDSAGYAGMFETVVDSHLVGVEKPDPGIFHIALERMGVGVEHAIYLGDVPAVDIAGARAAGLAPVLLDRHDLYRDLDVPRLRSIQELISRLDRS